MKKVKIMLLSLLVLAVAGGALAGKAKFSQKWCTTVAVSENNVYFCPTPDVQTICNLREAVTTTSAAGVVPICTTITNGNPVSPCLNVTNCGFLTKPRIEQ